jgi:hypothetical protein
VSAKRSVVGAKSVLAAVSRSDIDENMNTTYLQVFLGPGLFLYHHRQNDRMRELVSSADAMIRNVFDYSKNGCETCLDIADPATILPAARDAETTVKILILNFCRY